MEENIGNPFSDVRILDFRFACSYLRTAVVFKSSGFLIFWFYEFHIFEFLDFRLFWLSDFQVFRFSDSLHFKFWIVGFSDFRIPRFSNVLVSDFQTFRLSDFLILGLGDIQIFGFAAGRCPRYPPFQCWRIIKYSLSLLAGVLQNQQHWTWACKGGWKDASSHTWYPPAISCVPARPGAQPRRPTRKVSRGLAQKRFCSQVRFGK